MTIGTLSEFLKLDYVLREHVSVCLSVRKAAEQSDAVKPTDQKPCTNRTTLIVRYTFDPERPVT